MRNSVFKWLFIITELFLVINEPYAFQWIIPLPELMVTAILYLIFLLLMVTSTGKKHSLPSSVSVGFFITITTWFIYFVYFSDSSYVTRIALLVITYFFLLCFNKKEDFYRFWQYNNRFILLQAFLASICFVLVGVGLLKPLLTVELADSYKQIGFYGGTFTKSVYGSLIRVAGFFDEPGALACWAVYGLMFNFAFIKDKLLSKYLPYLVLPTLSIAYVFQMGLFLALKNIKKIQNLVSVAILVFVLIWAVTLTRGTNFDVYERTIGRLMYDEETVIAGNSRQDHMENAMELFQKSPIVGVGSSNMGQMYVIATDNPYEILAKDGIIGYIISYLPLIMILFINRRKEVLICLIVIFAGYQQRPLHINFMHDLYIWSFLVFAIIDAKERKQISNILKKQ